MNRIILINGKDQTKLSVFNRLVQFGDGLFETCLVVDHKLILAEAHFKRLEKGAKRLKISPIARSVWIKEIAKAVFMAKLDNAVVKIILSVVKHSEAMDMISPSLLLVLSWSQRRLIFQRITH